MTDTPALLRPRSTHNPIDAERRFTLTVPTRQPDNRIEPPRYDKRKELGLPDRPKASQVLSGHDAVLNAVQKSGRTIFIELPDRVVCGRLIARDPFTVTVEVETSFPGHNRFDPATGLRTFVAPQTLYTPRVFYKSQIVSFWAEPKEA